MEGAASQEAALFFDPPPTAVLLTGVLGIDGARDEVALRAPAAGWGVFPSVEDDLQVELVPAVFWKKTLGVALGLFHTLAVGHFPSG